MYKGLFPGQENAPPNSFTPYQGGSPQKFTPPLTLKDLMAAYPGVIRFYKYKEDKVQSRVEYNVQGRVVRLRRSLIRFGNSWYAIYPRAINEEKIAGDQGSIKFLAPIDSQHQLSTLIIDDSQYTIAKKKNLDSKKIVAFQNEATITGTITGFGPCLQTRGNPPHKPHGVGNRDEFIMRRIPGEDLFCCLEKGSDGLPMCVLPLNDALGIAILAVRALKELHQEGYIHCDLKLENIMFDPEARTLFIVDFGFSKQATSVEACCGSIPCVAPETYLSRIITPLSDIFSLGVVLCFLFNIFNPFWQREEFLAYGRGKEIFKKEIDKDYVYSRCFLNNYDDNFIQNHELTVKELIAVLASMTAADSAQRLQNLDQAEKSLLSIYNRLFFPGQSPNCDLQWLRVS